MGRRRRSGRAYPSGLLVVDKPRGLSSFDVVRRVRKAMDVRKVGHGGTLDPLATGVLPICVNEATKIAELLLGAEKAYLARGVLGVQTDTLDSTGEVVARSASVVEESVLQQALARFRGEIEQTPPAFSAIRVGGRRAYELARAGVDPELPRRRVCVEQLELRAFDFPEFEIFVRCTKGTYIRSLVADIGQALGCGATVAGLRRTQSGRFDLNQAISLEAVEAAGKEHPLIAIDVALAHLPAADLEMEQALRLLQGRSVDLDDQDADPVRIRVDGEVIGVGSLAAGKLVSRRLFGTIFEALRGGAGVENRQSQR